MLIEIQGKNVSADFEEVAHEVATLHTAIKEVTDEAQNPDSILNRAGIEKTRELQEIIRNCKLVISDLERILTKYKSLGTGSKRAWDRIKFGASGLQEIREKVTFHTSSISLYLTTLGTGSLGRIEKRLDEIVKEVQSGRREPSILSSVDDDLEDADAQWNALKAELLDEGFTKQDIEAHKRDIKVYLASLIDNGKLWETGLPSRTSRTLYPTLDDLDPPTRPLSTTGILPGQNNSPQIYGSNDSQDPQTASPNSAYRPIESSTGRPSHFERSHRVTTGTIDARQTPFLYAGDQSHKKEKVVHLEDKVLAPRPCLPPLPPIAQSVTSPSPDQFKRPAPIDENHEDVTEYDEDGRLRRRTVIRRSNTSSPTSILGY